MNIYIMEDIVISVICVIKHSGTREISEVTGRCITESMLIAVMCVVNCTVTRIVS